MAKTPKTTRTLPAGLKLSHTRNRKGVAMVLAFVDKDAGIYESRKGAVARAYDLDGLLQAIEEKNVLSSLTRVSRTPAVQPAKGATKTKAAPANAELEEID